jgi:predicted nuclease of predicted toxin-antitoxin system
LRLLFDQNLAHSLVRRLDDQFPNSTHLSQASLETATDAAVWLLDAYAAGPLSLDR